MAAGKKALRQKLAKAGDMRLRDWMFLLAACLALLEARIIFAILPARKIVERLQRETARPIAVDGATRLRLNRLDVAVSRGAGILPWRTDCLVRCLAAHRILGVLGLPSEFRIGFAKDTPDALLAHAWLTSSGIPVAGGDGAGLHVMLGPDGPAALRSAGQAF